MVFVTESFKLDKYQQKFFQYRGAEVGSDEETKLLKELAGLVDCHIDLRALENLEGQKRKELVRANRHISWERMMEVCACAGNEKTDLSVQMAEKMAKIADTREDWMHVLFYAKFAGPAYQASLFQLNHDKRTR